MTDAIRLAITLHEPRLKRPMVALGHQRACRASLHFLIKGAIDTDGRAPLMNFRAEFVSTTAHFAVRAGNAECSDP